MGDDSAKPHDIGRALEEIKAAASKVPRDQLLGFIQGAVLRFDDPVFRQALEDLLIHFYRLGAPESGLHVIVLIHGIRTQAVWQEPLADALNAVPGVSAKPIRYGYLDTARFITPVFARNGPVDHIEKQLRTIIGDHRGARVSVIAHSFGTYAISEILYRSADIRLYRLILCGSIVRSRFSWARVSSQIEKPPIVNECGVLDVWPVLASIATWGYGPSGTFGFQEVSPLNRFYALKHSGFLSGDFYRSAWLPLFDDPSGSPGPGANPRPSSPGWFTPLSMAHFKWLLVLGLIVVAYLMLHPLISGILGSE